MAIRGAADRLGAGLGVGRGEPRLGASIEARNAELDKSIAAIEADTAELNKQLVLRYEQHVGNMERGAGGEKQVLQRILEEDFVSDGLKQRVRALMVNPRSRWRD